MQRMTLWRAAAVGCDHSGYALRDQIVRDFKRCYLQTSKPTGVALFELTDSAGDLSSLYLTPEAMPHCTSLLEAYQPWIECLPPHPSIAHLSWIAGDQNVLRY